MNKSHRRNSSSSSIRNLCLTLYLSLSIAPTVHAVLKECNLQCDNGGVCSLQPLNAHPSNSVHAKEQQHSNSQIEQAPTDGHLAEFCLCPPSYTGLTCSEPTNSMNECYHYQGNHRCKGGGFCRPLYTSTYDLEVMKEQTWKCDCLVADSVSNFAGAMCRDPSTEYCDQEGNSFCTNGGTCENNLVEYDAVNQMYHNHRGDKCLCAPEFTGPHCEFLKAYHDHDTNYFSNLNNEGDDDSITSPLIDTSTIHDTSSDNDNKSNILTGIFITIGLLGVAGAGIIASMRKLRRGGRGQSNIAAMSHFESDHSLSLSPSSSVSLVQASDHSLSISPSSSASLIQSVDLNSICTYSGAEVLNRNSDRQRDWLRTGTHVRADLFQDNIAMFQDNIAMGRVKRGRVGGKMENNDQFTFQDVVL